MKTKRQKSGFDYAAVADETVRTVARDGAQAIKALLRGTAEAVVEIGRTLQAIRDALGSSAFRDWVQAEFQWDLPCAYTYMAAARKFGDVDCLDKLQPSALTQLARRSAPPKAVAEAIDLARRGEVVTARRAKELIGRHGAQPVRRDAGQPRRTAAAAAPAAVLTALRSSLDRLAGHVADLSLSKAEREELADRFLQLAMELRSLSRSAA